MCQHLYQLEEGPLTREERLMDREEVRAHHQRLLQESYESDEGRIAFAAHARLHHEAALALRAERVK